MQYVYMNNLRGFSKALIPVRKCNFLVGENSTGKSSFLSILKLLSEPEFYFYPRFTFGEDKCALGFSDIVSAWATDKSYFDVGIANVGTSKSGRVETTFHIYRFCEQDAHPLLTQYIQRRDKSETHIRFGSRSTEYAIRTIDRTIGSTDDGVQEFWETLDLLDAPQSKFKKFPKGIPAHPPLGIAKSILSTLESGENPKPAEFKLEVPSGNKITWIAPIRTKPQRIYEGLSREYSSEGEHSPFVLKQQLRSKRFSQKLAEFGDASGLYEAISTHTFGKGTRNPFEVVIRFKGADLNIGNVGYGVSQALPLVVEFLSHDSGHRFAVQQPEVHLHPKAQAALGSLMFHLANERKHSFLIETHSDYLIDRFRLEMAGKESAPSSQVLFFCRTESGNTATAIEIDGQGRYPMEQPAAFRDFFIREEMRLLAL